MQREIAELKPVLSVVMDTKNEKRFYDEEHKTLRVNYKSKATKR